MKKSTSINFDAGVAKQQPGKILSTHAQLDTSIILIKLGARSTLVQHITGMADVKVRALCHEIGMPPTKGQSPSNPLWFAKVAHRSEAIFFYSIVMRLMAAVQKVDVHTVPASLFITAYQRYVKHNNSVNKLDINRAWQLLDCVRNKSIQVVHCDDCHGVHMVIEGDVIKNCNYCIWCELKQNRHCPECGKKHAPKYIGVATTQRVCVECKNIRRLVRADTKFTSIHNVVIA